MAALGAPVVPDVNCRLMTSCSDSPFLAAERSKWLLGISLNRMKFESSLGTVPELLMMTICFKDGTTGEGEDKDNEGTMCFSSGICDRLIRFGVVMNTFVSSN